MVIRYDASLNLLVSTKGHPYDKSAFFAMFDDMRDMTWTHVEQPATTALMTPENASNFDAFLFYDVPGLQFKTPEPPDLLEPTEAFKTGFRNLMQAGKPMVFLHHAIAGWPMWDEYAEAIGTRFFYQSGSYKGREHPDSGYLFPVEFTLDPVGDHPITQGIDSFTLTDELYLLEMLEEDIVPLVRAEYTFEQDNFYSAANALNGRMWSRKGWSHGPGTNLIAWARAAGNAPIVTILCGNDASTYGDTNFRKLLRNAICWVTSDEAADWAHTR